MATWTNKQEGAVIGVVLVFLIGTIGWGFTALAVLVAIAGYFVGKFLDGELELEDIRMRAQVRSSDTRLR